MWGAPASLMVLMCLALVLSQAARPKRGSARKGAERLLVPAGPCGDPSSRSTVCFLLQNNVHSALETRSLAHPGVLTAPDSPDGCQLTPEGDREDLSKALGTEGSLAASGMALSLP